MSWTIIKKFFFDFKRSLFWYGLTFVLYSLMMVSFFPSLRDQSAKFNELISVYPEAITKGFGIDVSTFGTLEGFLAVEYFSIVWLIIMGVISFSLGASIMAGEIDKGTSEFTFSLPIKRWKVVISKFVSSVIFQVVINFVILFSTALGFYAVDETPKWEGFGALFLAMIFTSFFMLALATFLSVMLNSKSRVYALAGGFLTASYFLDIISKLIEKAADLKWFTFIHYYGDAQMILSTGNLEWINLFVLGGIGLVLVLGSLLLSEKRDLR
ncbi:MAG: ABC transporter permease subunit [bacterium]